MICLCRTLTPRFVCSRMRNQPHSSGRPRSRRGWQPVGTAPATTITYAVAACINCLEVAGGQTNDSRLLWWTSHTRGVRVTAECMERQGRLTLFMSV